MTYVSFLSYVFTLCFSVLIFLGRWSNEIACIYFVKFSLWVIYIQFVFDNKWCHRDDKLNLQRLQIKSSGITYTVGMKLVSGKEPFHHSYRVVSQPNRPCWWRMVTRGCPEQSEDYFVSAFWLRCWARPFVGYRPTPSREFDGRRASQETLRKHYYIEVVSDYGNTYVITLFSQRFLFKICSSSFD